MMVPSSRPTTTRMVSVTRGRTEGNVGTGKPVNVTLLCHADEARAVLESLQAQFASLDTRATVTVTADASQKPENTVSASIGEVEVFLSLAGLVDTQQEIERFTKERDRLVDYIAKLDARLADEKFASRAPAHVIAGERARRDEAALQLARAEERLASLR